MPWGSVCMALHGRLKNKCWLLTWRAGRGRSTHPSAGKETRREAATSQAQQQGFPITVLTTALTNGRPPHLIKEWDLGQVPPCTPASQAARRRHVTEC